MLYIKSKFINIKTKKEKEMKKLLALLLSAAMVLGLTACGDGFKTDKKASAEDVFSAAVTNLSQTVKTMFDKDAEANPFSFKLTGNVTAGLDLPAELAGKDGASDLTITASAKASGLADNKKGASAAVTVETDAMKVLGSMLGGLGSVMGGSSSSAENLKIETGFYADLESGKAYVLDPDTKAWSVQDFDPKEAANADLKDLETLTLDKVFETYTFTVEKEAYIFEGTAKADAVDLSDLNNQQISSYAGMIKDLKPALKLTVDPQKRLTGAVMTVKDYKLDLTAAMGMSATVKDLSLDLSGTYGPVNYQLPDEVKNAAAQ